MADKEKVIKALDEHLHCSGRGKSGYCPYSDDELWDDISDALALLKEQEEQLAMMRMIYGSDAKVVGELVRCKDCKHWWYGNYCDKHGKGQENADWFCADGERRETE